MSTCCCAGCARCSHPCPNPIRTAVQFADYCRKCHHNHLCSRCNLNAVASSSVESFCSSCLSSRSSWCACTGCKAHGGHHEGRCPRDRQNAKTYAGYCVRCAAHWKCPACGAALSGSPTGDLQLACNICRPSQCLCVSCEYHAPATIRCPAPGNSASGGYCNTCAPAWRCSCLAQCYHHGPGSQCSGYVSSSEVRCCTPTSVFNICARCSWLFCACGKEDCGHHPGRLCGKRRNVGNLCHTCVPSSNCHCRGCLACSSSPCPRPSHFHDGDGSCVPCARAQAQQLAASSSWDIKFPCESFAESLDRLSSFDCSNFVGARLVRVRALLKVVRARAFAEVPNVDLTSATPQTFVMLRLSASHEWSCFAFRHFWYNHCMTKRYADVRFSTELTAEDFHAIGATYGLPYGGTFKHCHGDVANFASILTDFPQYPFDIPARLRPTYWKLPRDCGAEDLIPASLDAMILSVVYCIHGAVPECSPVAWEQHLQSFVRLACDDDLGRPAMLQCLSSFLQHTTAEAWSSLPARLARPVLLSDYHALAARVGYRYCGLSLEPRALQAGLIPPTITSSRCVFLPLASDIAPEPARDDFWEQAWEGSYLRLYLA